MYVVMNRIDSDAPDRFEKGFGRSMRATLDGVPGLVRSALLRPESEGAPYVSVMEFVDEQAFKDWMGSESFRRAHAGIREQEPTTSSIETYSTVLEMTP